MYAAGNFRSLRQAVIWLCIILLLLGTDVPHWLSSPVGSGKAYASGASLIANAGFESSTEGSNGGWSGRMADGWSTWRPAGSPVLTVTESQYYGGANALEIRASVSSKATVTTGSMPVAADAYYRFGGYIRTLEATQAFIRVTFYSSSGAQLAYFDTSSVSGTKEWTYFRNAVKAPAQAATAKLSCYFNTGTGTAWFDDMELASITPIEQIAFAEPNGTLPVGSTLQLELNTVPAQAPLPAVAWSSSDSGVAAVDGGLVTALGSGEAVVTASILDETSNQTLTAQYRVRVPQTDGNLVINGGFEETEPALAGDNWTAVKPMGWSQPWLAGGFPQVTVDQEVSHSGAGALRISAASASKAVAGQMNIPVREGQSYRIAAWVKTESISSQVFVRLYFYGAEGNQIAITDTAALSGTRDWTLLEKTVAAPAGAYSVQLANYYDTGSGTVWFDGVSAIQVIPLQSISFEVMSRFVQPGGSLTVEPEFFPAGTTERQLAWSSSNPSVAAVEKGVVTGLTPGIAIIEAASPGGLKARMAVSVGEGQKELEIGNFTAVTAEDGEVNGALPSTDDEEQPLTYSTMKPPAFGALYLRESGEWTYYPQAGISGQDSFIAVASNSNGDLGIGAVEITIQPVNHAPQLQGKVTATIKNVPVQDTAGATDADGDPLTYMLAEAPVHGAVQVAAGGEWTYAPNTDYIGPDRFSIRVFDGRGGMDEGEITVMTGMGRGEIADLLEARNSAGRLPRIIAGADDFERIRTLVLSDENMARWYNVVKTAADEVKAAPVVQYELDNGQLLQVSRKVLANIRNLSMTYRVSGDSSYAERAWQELAAISAFPDWNPAHFLDTAEMTAAAAIGYDWLYDYLSVERRSILRGAIAEKGLQAALPYYRNQADWTTRTNNWNSVCNGGIALGALAIAGEDPALDEVIYEIVEGGILSLPIMLKEYGPDGGWFEGPTYWDYGTSYMVYFLAALEQALGTDMGLSSMPGVAETVLFPMYMTGTNGTFNFADASADFVVSPSVLWFAGKFADSRYAWFHKEMSNNARGGVFDLIWYRPELYQSASMPDQLDERFGYVEAAGMRSAWEDDNALFVGLKGGNNQFAHGDLDIGTFIFDALGIRWITDFGAESYSLPGYWEYGAEGRRWTYYRKRAEAHNTLVINPDSQPDQNPYAVAALEDFYWGASEAWTVTDMTYAYRDDVLSAKRGIRLGNGRAELLVQDEIAAKGEAEVLWHIHTPAQATIAADGRSAILSQKDRRLYVELLSPVQGAFQLSDAAPLSTSPNPDGQSANDTAKTLGIRLENVHSTTIAVRMVPLMPGQVPAEHSEAVVPLSEWSKTDRPRAELAAIVVGGAALEDFRGNKSVYQVSLPFGTSQAPSVAGIGADPSVTVSVTMPEALPGLAVIEAESQDGSMVKSVYYVNFSVEPLLGLPEEAQLLPVASVSASAVDQGYVPENTLDGNLDETSRWSAVSGNWIQYDLGASRDIGGIALAFMRGDQRKTDFQIVASNDGDDWSSIMVTSSSGASTGYEYYETKNLSARYIRIIGYGNSTNNFTSITEAAILGLPMPAQIRI